MEYYSKHGNGGAVTILPPPVKKTVSGYSLAHRHLTKRERAILAANLFDGQVRLTPTQRQVADMCGVSLTYVRYALALPPDVRVPANVRPPRHVPAKVINSDIADSELVKAIRTIGIERVLEAAVAAEAAE
jgi:hypothetical protein